MAEQERTGAAQQQGWTKLPDQQGNQIKLQPMMVLRAGAAVLLCVACILYLFSIVIFKGSALLWLFAAAELAFCVHYYFICVPFFTDLANKQSPEDHEPEMIKTKLLEQLLRVDDIMGCMESWFVNAGPGDVKKHNLKELFAYAIWYRSISEMDAEGLMPQLDDLMAQLEKRYGRRLPPGYNPNLKFMSHLWEPLRHIYRPLFFYIVMELLALLCHVALTATGFSLCEIDGITYYTFRMSKAKLVAAISNPLKRCRSSPAVAAAANNPQDLSTTPIIFLHGVGAGLLPYLSLIFRLAALNRPMILPHSRHVSMRLVSWIPTVDDMADATAAMLAAHSFSQASVVAHSYGTMVASRLVMKYPQLVHSMCLTDPVCFAMFMPNLLRNFLYARHNSGCWPLDFIMRLVASELHCCANFSRKFFWSSINLWDEHIPDRTLVVLGGQDILSPAVHLNTWLREHTHAQVMYEPQMRHAGMVLSMSYQADITTAFVDVMQQPARRSSDDGCSQAADATVTVTAAAAPTAAAKPKAKAVKQQLRSHAQDAAQELGGAASKQRLSISSVHSCTGTELYSRLDSDCLISRQRTTPLLAGLQAQGSLPSKHDLAAKPQQRQQQPRSPPLSPRSPRSPHSASGAKELLSKGVGSAISSKQPPSPAGSDPAGEVCTHHLEAGSGSCRSGPHTLHAPLELGSLAKNPAATAMTCKG